MTDYENETPPRPLEERLSEIRTRLSGASELLVCLDFDGTLAPIVEDPDDATPTRDNREAVATLAAEPAVTTAVVSGRALADVRERIDGPSVYAGNHGLELARRGSVAVHPVARKRAVGIERVCSILEVLLDPVPGTRIENKRLTGTVHVRSVPPAARRTVRRLVERTVDRFGGGTLELSSGKRIFEIGPAIPWGKGNAVDLIAADLPPETVAIYLGDDVTDESAFRAVEPDGVGIRVGDARPSRATARVQSPADVASFLHWLGTSGVELVERTNAGKISTTNVER